MVGCALRLIGLDVHSLWFDEGATWFVMRQADIVAALETDRHPPLSFYAFRVWAELVGDSASALRLLPALCSCAALVVARVAYERLLTPRAALVATVLHALSSFAIWHAQEMRMYAMLELSAGLLLFGYAAMRRRHVVSACATIAVGSFVGCGSHYFGYLGVAALFATLWLESLLCGQSRKVLLWLTVALVVSSAAWLPLLLSMLPAQRGTTWGWTAQMNPLDIALLPTRFLIRDGEALGGLLYWTSHACAGVVSLALIAIAASIVRKRDLRASLGGVLALAVLPVLGAFVVAVLIAPSFMPRYLIAALPATIALIAAGLEFVSLGSRALHTALVAVVVVPLVAIGVVHKTENRREDYRGAVTEALAAAAASTQAKPTLLVVITGTAPGFSTGPVEFYARQRARVLDAKDFVAELEQRNAPPPHELFVIHRTATYSDIDYKAVTSLYDQVDIGPTRHRLRVLRCSKPKR